MQQEVELWQEGKEAQHDHERCQDHAAVECEPSHNAISEAVSDQFRDQQQGIHHFKEHDRRQPVQDVRHLIPMPVQVTRERPEKWNLASVADRVELDVLADADAQHLQPEAVPHVLRPRQDHGVGRGAAHGHGLRHVAARLHPHDAQRTAPEVQGTEEDWVDWQLLTWDDVVRNRRGDDDHGAVAAPPDVAPGELLAVCEEGQAQAPPVEAVRVAPEKVVERQSSHGHQQRPCVEGVPGVPLEGQPPERQEALAGDGAEDAPLHGAADDGQDQNGPRHIQHLQEVVRVERDTHQGQQQHARQ
mmetsp:Transcript_86735/g.253847  ORF Transcript_86735/g.253847 Transcript_86735/m.253847 type:complete len:302 (-) Transcript_86735:20-925(-)